MRRILFWLPLTILAAYSIHSIAQQKSPPPTEAEAKKLFSDMMERGAVLTDAHKALGAFVGEFDLRSEVLMGPTPIHAHGISKGTAIMGGRFVKIEGANAPDEELKGERLMVFGYDPSLKKYTVWQVETGSLAAITGLGDFDAATKTFLFEGELPNKIPYHWSFKVEEGGIQGGIDMKLPGQGDYAREVNVKWTRKK